MPNPSFAWDNKKKKKRPIGIWNIDLNLQSFFSYHHFSLSLKTQSWSFFTSLTRAKSECLQPTLVKVVGALLPRFGLQSGCRTPFYSCTGLLTCIPQSSQSCHCKGREGENPQIPVMCTLGVIISSLYHRNFRFQNEIRFWI